MIVAAFELCCSRHAALEEAMREAFVAMRSMFFPGSTVPTFADLLATLREFDALVAHWNPA
jgi:hypothetical protein